MINQQTFQRLRRVRTRTPNLPALGHLDGRLVRDGERTLFPAPRRVREWAQNLIDHFDGHAHLRRAQVLVLMARGGKASADGILELGRAAKATRLLRLLAGSPEPAAVEADFILTLNADFWDTADDADKLALLDHELSHCAVTIAGRFVPPAKLAEFLKALGEDFVEHVEDRTDDADRQLVRYRRRRGDRKPGEKGYHAQPLAWRMRKHDVEQFLDVLGRWGPSAQIHRPLWDVLDAPEETTPLLDHTQAAAAQDADGGDQA